MRKVTINGIELTEQESINVRKVLLNYIHHTSVFMLMSPIGTDHGVLLTMRRQCFDMVQMIEEDLPVLFNQTAQEDEKEDGQTIEVGGVKLNQSYRSVFNFALGTYTAGGDQVNIIAKIPVLEMKELLRVVMLKPE